MPPRALIFCLSLLACGATAGCYFWQSASVPVATVSHKANGPSESRGLVVLLPGIFDGPEDLLEQGFVRQLNKRAPGYDAIAVNLHLGYYNNGSFVTRLHQDVIVPAHRDGYRDIWLVGISLGGYGALSYARVHPKRIRGVLALAPYLGDSDVLDEVRKQGGACHFEAGELSHIEDQETRFTRSLWGWFAARCATPNLGPPIYLAYGDEDRMLEAAELLATALPPDHVSTRPGGHEWGVWQRLFEDFLKGVLAPHGRASLE